jgi:Fe-S oxidoreductase
VVIPLDRLAEYSDGIERINIEQSIRNKLAILAAVRDYFSGEVSERRPSEDYDESQEDSAIFAAKQQAAIAFLDRLAARWQQLYDHLDDAASHHRNLLDEGIAAQIASNDTLFRLLQRRLVRVSWRQEAEQPLKEIFSGRHLEGVRNRIDAIHARIRPSRLFVATHMHAGDGNVHTNIPVHSSDYAMLQEADRLVARIMRLAESLGGVISGEHGIGITKLEFLSPEVIRDFTRYKQQVDPSGHFNRGKLLAGGDLRNAYTPSLRLLQQEALILEASELGELNSLVKDCLRCGKCKPVCNTHIPRANLLYSPRNKILATGLIIEAFLYEEQTRRGISIRHFDELNDVADHCTVCHKCANPCPVKIDFGDVSVKMRTILRQRGQKRINGGTRLSMLFLNATDPRTIHLLQRTVIGLGYRAQRLGYRLGKLVGLHRRPPGATTGKPPLREEVIHLISRPLPAPAPARTLRAQLGIEDARMVPILRDPARINEQSEAVFYFPGCGSERLFSSIGMATLAMLHHLGTQTILPPGYLCCGYPQSAGGDEINGRRISTANQVLFHRVANTLNYMDIRTVIVSCGTCLDQLLKYQFAAIFPGCRLLDIHEYLYEKGVKLDGIDGQHYLFHDPCHTPMKQHAPQKVAATLLGQTVAISDRCCGEAGTLAVARPDISSQVRMRKEEELIKGIERATASSYNPGNIKLLTACPACQQGLSRYADSTGLATDYLVAEVAERYLGHGWQQRFIDAIQQGGVERVLL